MKIEEELKNLILSKYKSLREFSIELNMPYSTLDTILKRGIQKASINNIIKICNCLDISTDELANEKIVAKNDSIKRPNYTNHEKELIKKYRRLDKRGKQAVDDTLEREYRFVNPKIEDTAM